MPGPTTVKVPDCLPFFQRLVKFVRLSHLDSDEKAAVVTACPLAAESGLLPYMLSLSLANRKAEEQGANSVLLERGRGNLDYTFTSTLELADVLNLVPGTDLCKYVGLVDGYPMRLQLSRDKKEEKTLLGIFVYVLMPIRKTKNLEGGMTTRSVNLAVTLRAEEVRRGPF